MQLQTRAPGLKGRKVKVNGNYYDVDSQLCVNVEDGDDVAKLLATGWTDEVLRPGTRRPRGRAEAAPPSKPRSSLSSAKEFVQFVAGDEAVQEQCGRCQTFSELHTYAQGLGYGFTKSQLESARAAYIARVAPVRPAPLAPPDPRKLSRQAAEASKKVPTPPEDPPPNPEADDLVSSPYGAYSLRALATRLEGTGLLAKDVLAAAFAADQSSTQSGELTPELLQGAVEQLQADARAVAEAEAVAQAAAAAPAPPEEPDPPDAWPDPDPSMKLDYLRSMADAYAVPYAGVKKADLIKAIQAAMYD
jgi:hypothetical protein